MPWLARHSNLILGPESFLSICSTQGMKWVVARTEAPNFVSSAASLASFVAKSLKLPEGSKIERVSEPDSETAWQFTQGMLRTIPNS
jgi:hypothetical protein